MEFKEFLNETESEYKEDIKDTLKKLPKSHAALVAGYKFEFQNSNTLKNDDGHVGLIDPKKKRIIIASPWHYARSLTLLHEIGHLVWAKFVTPEMKKEWGKIVKRTRLKKSARQSAEELFCMSYGATYSKHPPTTYFHPDWEKFIKRVPS